ncbi:hypothetical protein [Flavobacterium sp. 3HN19-14]|uniref:hypothetical protein n=1 Tax=Flavobacterium sp. 3HN19-14 TaxID=3448133 RepID=UPI003EE37D35
MKNPTSAETLRHNIALLEIKREEDWQDLRNHFNETIEHYKPMNLIKNAFKGAYESVTHSPDLKSGIGKAALGLTTGFLLKKVLFGGNPIARLAGAAFQTVASNVVANNADKIKSTGSKVFDFIKSKFSKN